MIKKLAKENGWSFNIRGTLCSLKKGKRKQQKIEHQRYVVREYLGK
jgi:hypothetical protein